MPKKRTRRRRLPPPAAPPHVPNVAERANHTAAGKFKPGNTAARGHGGPRDRAALVDALRGAITPEEVAQLARVMLRRALRGDVRAAGLLLDRVLGRCPIRVFSPLDEDADDSPESFDDLAEEFA